MNITTSVDSFDKLNCFQGVVDESTSAKRYFSGVPQGQALHLTQISKYFDVSGAIVSQILKWAVKRGWKCQMQGLTPRLRGMKNWLGITWASLYDLSQH